MPAVLAIGLDAAEPALLEWWMAAGKLPTLARLRTQGVCIPLQTRTDWCRAEIPWTIFLTGCSPAGTGYWGPLVFDPSRYSVEQVGAFDGFSEHPPFYALGRGHRVAVFDMPQARLDERVDGVQALAWGAHSPLTAAALSHPPDVLPDLRRRFGAHPTLLADAADVYDPAALQSLKVDLITGIERRAAICRDLLKRERWHLFLTVFGEIHAALHCFWHLSQPHPLAGVADGSRGDPALEIFQAIDRALGDIIDAAPPDAHVLVFSVHGMGTNNDDVSSNVFLPELLYRWNFPGCFALAKGDAKAPPPVLNTHWRQGWARSLWRSAEEPNPLRRLMRRNAPIRVHAALDALLGPVVHPPLAFPNLQERAGDPLHWLPANWYKPLWPEMRAFALPSYAEGYIRLNVRGREPSGLVAPADYPKVCDELRTHLNALKDARSGRPLVRRIVQPRSTAAELDGSLPDADLIVLWNDEPADVVDSPSFGRIGPVRFHRTGGHRAGGVLFACGPGIPAGAAAGPGDILDLAPTMLALIQAPVPDHLEGRALFAP